MEPQSPTSSRAASEELRHRNSAAQKIQQGLMEYEEMLRHSKDEYTKLKDSAKWAEELHREQLNWVKSLIASLIEDGSRAAGVQFGSLEQTVAGLCQMLRERNEIIRSLEDKLGGRQKSEAHSGSGVVSADDEKERRQSNDQPNADIERGEESITKHVKPLPSSSNGLIEGECTSSDGARKRPRLSANNIGRIAAALQSSSTSRRK